MSIFASKCPFFSSTIEIVRNLKISKLQLAIEFSDGLGSWYKVCRQFFHFDPFLDKRFGFSHEHGSWYKYVIDFSIMTVILEMGCLDIPTRLTVQICHRFLHLDSHSWIGCLEFPTTSAHGT